VNRNPRDFEIRRAEEELRQLRDAFDQKQSQEAKWFRLRLTIGYCSITLLGSILVVAYFVLYNHGKFPTFTVDSASMAVFADLIGLVVIVWKVTLNPQSTRELAPVTISGISANAATTRPLTIERRNVP
jgi:hypothetical protein